MQLLYVEFDEQETGGNCIMHAMVLTAGTRLGPYEIVESIGAGGMGEVYRALDPRIGRDVAIKILPSSMYFSIV